MTALQKILLLLCFLVGHIGIASEDYTIQLTNPPDSCECPCGLIGYTDIQDQRCLECIVNRTKIDSNLRDKDTIIAAQKGQLELQGEEITICTQLASNQRGTIQRQDKSIKWMRVIIGAITGVAVVELIIILAK